MKKQSSFFAAAVLGGAVTAAYAAPVLDMDKTNANAVVQVLLEQAVRHSGKEPRPLAYVTADEASFVCIGEIPKGGVTLKTDKGKDAFYKPLKLELIEFAYKPDARDKAAQENVRTLLETRKDLGYIEFHATGAPNAKAISAYFTDVLKSPPLDIFQAGTGMRDGSLRTTILLDKAALDTFAGMNAAAITKKNAEYLKSPEGPGYSYSACGPKSFSP